MTCVTGPEILSFPSSFEFFILFALSPHFLSFKSLITYLEISCKLVLHVVYVGGMSTSASKSTSASQRSLLQQNYQTPASALYETAEEPVTGNGRYLNFVSFLLGLF